MKGLHDYFYLSRTFTYGLLAALPLLILYEIGVRVVNVTGAFQVKIAADINTKWLFSLFGLIPSFWFYAGLIIIVAWMVIWENKDENIDLKWKFFALIFLEGMVLSFLLAPVIIWFLNPKASFGFKLPSLPNPSASFSGVVFSFGAGFYEELFFRVFLVGFIFWVLMRMTKVSNWTRNILAVLIAALIFSLAHYFGSLGDNFTVGSFLFRFMSGLVLSAIYVFRGFAIAAWTHALFDIWVLTEVF